MTVLGFDSIRNHRSYWNCRCSCGNIVTRRSDGIKQTQTCAKCKSEKQRKRMTEHGETKTKLYKVWVGMKMRCQSDITYTKRGIKVCDEWIASYESFRNHVVRLPHCGEMGYSLDRIDNNRGYEPNNVRWSTAQEQSRNTSANHLLTLNGETRCVKEWSEILNIKPSTLHNRIKLGWTDEEVLTRKVQKHRRVV